MTFQPQLFTDTRRTRKTAMEAAYDHAGEAFKTHYESLLMEFVESGKEFTGNDVGEAYRAKKHLPQPKKDFRATGYMYSALRENGRLEIVGYRKRPNGNPTAIYRGKRV